jgi:hypothetical protein
MFTADGRSLAAFVEQDSGRRTEVILWKTKNLPAASPHPYRR